MLFQIKTTLGGEQVLAYERITGKTVQWLKRGVCHWGLLVFGVLSLTFSAYGMAVSGGFQGGGVLGVFLGILSVVFGLNYYRYLAWKSARRVPENFEQTFSFGEEMMIAVGSGNLRFDHPYSHFFALAESQDYYVLFLNKITGYVLDKKGFTKGSAEEFRAFIQEKTGKRLRAVKL